MFGIALSNEAQELLITMNKIKNILSGFSLMKFSTFTLFASIFIGTSLHADPISVRPVAPIYQDTTVIGFSSTDPVVEFKVPDAWILKKDGVKKRTLADGNYELMIQVEPSYSLSESRERDLVEKASFKVFLPLPIVLHSAQLYLTGETGKLKAAFIPYPGNNNTGFYFRIWASTEQLETLFKLSKTGLSLTGDVSFDLTAEDVSISTAAPIKVSIPPWVLTPSDPVEYPPWLRDSPDIEKNKNK